MSQTLAPTEFTFSPAKRENVSLLIGLAGPSGSGKTLSALLLAKGLAGGKPFAVIDTERGRALHYADSFDFLHAELEPPFSPDRYGAAIKAAESISPSVIVVDSFSHEHAGEGGVLDMHEAELDRMAGNDWKKREAMKFAAWIKPKAQHKHLIQQLLQLKTHLIVCLRAEEKIDLVKENGKLVVKPKRTMAGHVGWIPICGKDLPYELTLSLVVTPDHPGVPHAIKLQEQHRALVSLEQPISEETGQRLATWARGSATLGEGNPAAGLADTAHDGSAGTESFPSPSAEQATLLPEGPRTPEQERALGIDILGEPLATETAATTPAAEVSDQPSLTTPEPVEAEDSSTGSLDPIVAQAGAVIIPKGNRTGKTVAQVAAEEPEWCLWYLANGLGEPLKAAITTYLAATAPEVLA